MYKSIVLLEFADWLDQLGNPLLTARIAARIVRLKQGNPGDSKSVGSGVFELRFQFGPGWRVYFAYHGKELVILLAGGNKSSQVRDILRAKQLPNQWRLEYDVSA